MKNPTQPKSVKDARHHAAVVSPMQAQRMRAGRVESRPEDYVGSRVSPLDKERAKVRKALEERAEMKALELATGDVW